ncbi:MAG TPA: flagellar hook-associated protein FlgK [Bacteroidetes bacterium]|jgi:flagellar hook-associated protein 1|nr:flagellar hook-associated protein FlgK [Bacteroidota bacterium]
MPGLSQILEIARRALTAQQMGMSVTSHNISNANTPGYSRQRVSLVATSPTRTTSGLLGTGVTVGHIGRVREQFIDQQIRLSNDSYGSATAQQRIFGQLEATLNEPSDAGLGAAMSRFFNSFQDLSVHPEESGPRNAVLQQGAMLSQTFRRLNSSLTQLRSDVGNDAQGMVDRINSLAGEISDLNVQITAAMSSGGDPVDLKDQRDLKIEELSTLANFNISEDQRGSVIVSLGGTEIVSGSVTTALSVIRSGDKMEVVSDASGSAVNATGGELGGMLKAFNTDISSALSKLDQLAGAIITRVNALHSGGYGLGTPPPTGNNFFSGTSAADIGVDTLVSGNINNIAASGTGAPGDNAVAIALSQVGSEPLLSGNSMSVTQFYGGFVSEVGSSLNAADNTARSQELILTQCESQRASVSGVSLDEEMTNLIKYQRSYDAAARVVNSVNELFLTILNMV